ncbi:MAG: DUF3301 domain-containing protein [Spongiibacteraceae bacterium]|jgi:hypothetical protein|nr:DUF3301 domain-containing protein [Spongiibacteraceae bacterium]
MYIELTHLLWLAVIGLVAGYAWQGHAAKEQALGHARRYCEREGVQLLDDSMVAHRRWLQRDESGKVRLWRRFAFEFAATGDERYRGHIDMAGARVASVHLEPHRVSTVGGGGTVIDMDAWRRLH